MPRSAPTKLLRDDIYARIKEAVLSCEIAPGAGMREQELAAQFGVSKSPVRDALHRLQSEGLIEVLPRKGYRVKVISLEDALELYEMRIILECACTERMVRVASKSDLAALETYKRGPNTKAQREWIDYNREFHIAIAGMCGNNRLFDATRDILQAFDRLTSTSLSQLESATTKGIAAFDKMDREHSEIIAALKERDAERAVRLMRTHVETSRTRFLESYTSRPRGDRIASHLSLYQGRKSAARARGSP
jgi:DNA-binding GntR family transcriptional regulator